MKRVLALLVSAALLAWLAHDGRWRELSAALARLTPPVIAIAAAGFLASYLLRALRVYANEIPPRCARPLRRVPAYRAGA